MPEVSHNDPAPEIIPRAGMLDRVVAGGSPARTTSGLDNLRWIYDNNHIMIEA